MANRGDVISVDKLWDIFDLEREKAWEGVDAPIGSQEWKAAAGKIDTINNICEAVHGMNTCSRADGEKAKKPVWRVKQSVVLSNRGGFAAVQLAGYAEVAYSGTAPTVGYQFLCADGNGGMKKADSEAVTAGRELLVVSVDTTGETAGILL